MSKEINLDAAADHLVKVFLETGSYEAFDLAKILSRINDVQSSSATKLVCDGGSTQKLNTSS